MQLGVCKYLVQVLQFLIVLILAAQFTFAWLDATGRSPLATPVPRLPTTTRRQGMKELCH